MVRCSCLTLLRDYVRDSYAASDPQDKFVSQLYLAFRTEFLCDKIIKSLIVISIRFAKHGTSFRGEELNLDIQSTSALRINCHSNNTFLHLRDTIAAQLGVAENFLHLYVDSVFIPPDKNGISLAELSVFPESSIIANVAQTTNDTPAPAYTPPVDANMALEPLMPGYRLAHRQDYLERLFEITELPFPALQKLASSLLMCLPTDPQELSRALSRVRIGAFEDSRNYLQLLLLKPRTKSRRLYNLQLVQALLLPARISPQSQEISLQFRQAFVDANGLQMLVDVVASSKDAPAPEAVGDCRDTFLSCVRIIRFLLWRGIHLDIKVLTNNPSLEIITDKDQKNEFVRKVAQEQRQTQAVQRIESLPVKIFNDALINIIWRSALGNWAAKSWKELADTSDPVATTLADVWLAHESIALWSFLVQISSEYLTASTEFSEYVSFHRDLLLRTTSARVRWMFFFKPIETISTKILPKTWTTLLSLLPSTSQFQETCKEYFDYLCYIGSKTLESSGQDTSSLLQAEIEWIQVRCTNNHRFHRPRPSTISYESMIITQVVGLILALECLPLVPQSL